jgi:hypothetical protein
MNDTRCDGGFQILHTLRAMTSASPSNRLSRDTERTGVDAKLGTCPHPIHEQGERNGMDRDGDEDAPSLCAALVALGLRRRYFVSFGGTPMTLTPAPRASSIA